MATFMKNAVEYGTFYVGETTEGTVILHPDVFEIEREHYELLNPSHLGKHQADLGARLQRRSFNMVLVGRNTANRLGNLRL